MIHINFISTHFVFKVEFEFNLHRFNVLIQNTLSWIKCGCLQRTQSVSNHASLSQFNMAVPCLLMSHRFLFLRLRRHPIPFYVFIYVYISIFWENIFSTMTSTAMLLAWCYSFPQLHCIFFDRGFFLLFYAMNYIPFVLWFLADFSWISFIEFFYLAFNSFKSCLLPSWRFFMHSVLTISYMCNHANYYSRPFQTHYQTCIE